MSKTLETPEKNKLVVVHFLVLLTFLKRKELRCLLEIELMQTSKNKFRYNRIVKFEYACITL